MPRTVICLLAACCFTILSSVLQFEPVSLFNYKPGVTLEHNYGLILHNISCCLCLLPSGSELLDHIVEQIL
jgi:hypothetical protein